MKPALEYLPRQSDESFVTRSFDYAYFPTPWHFHPEYEIVLVTESTGKRYIGDQISCFSPGDLVLLGPYLPHTYKNDDEYLKENPGLRAKSIVVHFREDSFGENFFSLPEAQPVLSLLKRSARGLFIKGNTRDMISTKLHELLQAQGLTRWLVLAEILNALAASNDLEPICKGIITGQNTTETKRMNSIIDFVVKNFNREIHVQEAAAIANMATNSFSRYFSNRTRKSFTAFVNEVRLKHASKLLMETPASVTQICMDCGFNNLSNFNRHFKHTFHYNPLTFRKLYQRLGS